MTTRMTSTFEVKSWDEIQYNEIEGLPKLTRASVTELLHGDIEGEVTVEYLMMYRDDGSASIVGQQSVVGRIGERSGSFVLQVSGTFEGGTAQGIGAVVPGSGTGDLQGLRGEGGFVAEFGNPAAWRFTLDYDLA